MYRKLFFVLFAVLGLCFAAACVNTKSGKSGSNEIIEIAESYEVKGVTFDMVLVEGGTFTMGALPDHRPVQGSLPYHQVLLDEYAISKSPVSQALWEAVMGGNPSSNKAPDLPVDRVSYKDCEKFVKKLSKLTGLPFTLPTEAQWEYANFQNKTTTFANCREWCSDFDSQEAPASPSLNPSGPEKGSKKIIRTGIRREAFEPHSKSGALIFRVALRTGKPCPAKVIAAVMDKTSVRTGLAKDKTYIVNGVDFRMIGVKGGKFKIGGTEEQGQYAQEDEKPVMEVEVGDFSIGQTEVTAELWKAVIGSLPIGNDEKALKKPVVNVSWYDCQEFILKLNALTGENFRLPDEAEWEYAARGGAKSRNYRYAGAHEIAAVAVYGENSDQKVKQVKSKRPNELGLYDMSGNAWEWCQDTYSLYGSSPKSGEVRQIMRGGSAAGRWDSCRLSNRSGIPAINIKSTFGFRLAL